MSIIEGWLNCKISEGMLPQEYAVVCTSSDNSSYSFFAPQDLIDIAKETVKVNILDCEGDLCLVNLPFTPFENHNRTIKVTRESIIGI